MTNRRRSERHENWKLLINEQEKSGKSQRSFCEAHGVSSSKMSYYRSVLAAQEKSVSQNNKKLMPITLKSAVTPSSVLHEIKIMLPNGFRCEIPEAVDASRLKSLMEVLLSC